VILVDSSVWIDYFRGMQTSQTDRLDALLGNEPVATGDSDKDFDPFVEHLGLQTALSGT
jgi:hypothetical protein